MPVSKVCVMGWTKYNLEAFNKDGKWIGSVLIIARSKDHLKKKAIKWVKQFPGKIQLRTKAIGEEKWCDCPQHYDPC